MFLDFEWSDFRFQISDPLHTSEVGIGGCSTILCQATPALQSPVKQEIKLPGPPWFLQLKVVESLAG